MSLYKRVMHFKKWSGLFGPPCICVATTPHSAPPYFTGPTLSDPAVINRQWIEFYCEFTTTSNDPGAFFVVQFLFDGMPASNVPDFTINGRTEQSHYSATLHERYLHGQLDKTVRHIKIQNLIFKDAHINFNHTQFV